MKHLFALLLLCSMCLGCVPQLGPGPAPIPGPPAPVVPTPTPYDPVAPKPPKPNITNAEVRANYYFAAADSVEAGYYENTGQLIAAMERIRKANGFPPGGPLLDQTVPALSLTSKDFDDTLRKAVTEQLRAFANLVRQGRA